MKVTERLIARHALTNTVFDRLLNAKATSVARCWLKKQPNVLIKQAQNQLKKLQSSPNYSPKYAIKLTVCSESIHHCLIAVAVFVQHKTDFLTKQPQTYKMTTVVTS